LKRAESIDQGREGGSRPGEHPKGEKLRQVHLCRYGSLAPYSNSGGLKGEKLNGKSKKTRAMLEGREELRKSKKKSHCGSSVPQFSCSSISSREQEGCFALQSPFSRLMGKCSPSRRAVSIAAS
jgi:hypothetical protein